MNHRPSTVLIIGATGSIGRYAVAEALQHGYAVRALVRDQSLAGRQPPGPHRPYDGYRHHPARRRLRPVEAAQ